MGNALYGLQVMGNSTAVHVLVGALSVKVENFQYMLGAFSSGYALYGLSCIGNFLLVHASVLSCQL